FAISMYPGAPLLSPLLRTRPSEDCFVKSKRSLDVGDGEKVRDGNPVLRRHLIAFLLNLYLAHRMSPNSDRCFCVRRNTSGRAPPPRVRHFRTITNMLCSDRSKEIPGNGAIPVATTYFFGPLPCAQTSL